MVFSNRTHRDFKLCVKEAILLFEKMLTLNTQNIAHETLLFSQLDRAYVVKLYNEHFASVVVNDLTPVARLESMN